MGEDFRSVARSDGLLVQDARDQTVAAYGRNYGKRRDLSISRTLTKKDYDRAFETEPLFGLHDRSWGWAYMETDIDFFQIEIGGESGPVWIGRGPGWLIEGREGPVELAVANGRDCPLLQRAAENLEKLLDVRENISPLTRGAHVACGDCYGDTTFWVRRRGGADGAIRSETWSRTKEPLPPRAIGKMRTLLASCWHAFDNNEDEVRFDFLVELPAPEPILVLPDLGD